MELKLRRIARRDTYTIGKLYVDGVMFCDTIEDRDRGLTQKMGVDEITRRKVYGETAIPMGRYEVDMSVPSAKYVKKAQTDGYYKTLCMNMPRLCNVKGYTGVLIHPGTDEKDTLGCILVGENKVVGKVINSRATFTKLHFRLMEAYRRKESIWIEIV